MERGIPAPRTVLVSGDSVLKSKRQHWAGKNTGGNTACDAAGRTHAQLHFSDRGALRIAEMLIQGQSHADLDTDT